MVSQVASQAPAEQVAISQFLNLLTAISSQIEAGPELSEAVRQLQDSALGVGPWLDLEPVFETGTAAQKQALSKVLDAAVSQAVLPDGTLVTWLVPILVDTDRPQAGRIDLEVPGLKLARLAGQLMPAVGMVTAEGIPEGWLHILPQLYSLDALLNASTETLIKVPRRVRRLAQGYDVKESMALVESGRWMVEPGVHVYFLPMVGFLPNPEGNTARQLNTELKQILGQWLFQYLPAGLSAHPVGTVAPFAEAVHLARLMRNSPAMPG